VIDFRYHLVSLVSVFLALAVGIVLGAGPLRESIGDTLTEQVQALRQEKDGLRADVATRTASVNHRDEFLTAVTPNLVGGKLSGRSVAIIRLPDVEDAEVDTVRETLATAGATITAQVEVNDAWVEDDQRLLREQVSAELRAKAPGTTDATDTGQQLAAYLARALVSGTPLGVDPVDTTAQGLFDTFDRNDLVGIEGDVSGLADIALVLVPGVTDQTGGQVGPTPSGDTLSSYVAVGRALATTGRGAVVTGPASSATNGGVVAAVRGDDAAGREISTVDTGTTPMGEIASVLALRERTDGGQAGAYGFGDGAAAPLPDVNGEAS
jgi:hypothetical protein